MAPHQLLVSVRPRYAASNQSERTPAAPSTCSFWTVGPARVDALWQPGQPSARHRQLCARQPSCDRLQASPRGPRSEAAGERIAKPSLCFCPCLKIFLVPAGGHVTTTCSHCKQREKKRLSPRKFSMDLLICVVACFLPDPWCDLLYPTGRPSLTASDGAVTLSCLAEWCITGTGAYSHGVCFICCIGAVLACLIYSLDLLRGLQSAHFRADNGGFTIKTSPCFDVLIMRRCYLDTSQLTVAIIYPRLLFLTSVFLIKAPVTLEMKRFGILPGILDGKNEWIRYAFVLIHTWTLDSGYWFNWHVNVQKNDKSVGSKVVPQLQNIIDLEVCLSLFFWQSP